ncbi:MAG: hypothetical protein WD382_02310 [Halofilum sp. (in: g-proteobacteria)]
MSSHPDLRLRLRVAVKLLVLTGVAGFAAVAVGFLFGGAPDRAGPVIRVSLAGLAPGEVRTVGWDARAVVILHRRSKTRARPGAEEAAPNAQWLVAHARGGEGCPVIWEAERHQFRETCGDARYDAAGQPLGSGYPPLEQPPHRIQDDVLILGRE